MKFLRRPSVIVSLAMIVFIVVLLVISFQYSLMARAAPLGAGILGIILILTSLVGEIFPAIGRRLSAGYFTTLSVSSASEEAASESTKSLAITLGWIVFFAFLVFIFGFIIATAVSVFIYFKWFRGMSWIKSLAMGGAMCAFVWFVFNVVISLGLFPGILFGGIIV